jgi:phenylacetate-CoA ligase
LVDHHTLVKMMDRMAQLMLAKDTRKSREVAGELDLTLAALEELSGTKQLAWQLRAAADVCAASLARVPFYQSQGDEYRTAVERFVSLGRVLSLRAPDAVVQAAYSSFKQIPIIDRPGIQNRMRDLENLSVQGAFRKTGSLSSSGSTGRPMESPRSAASLELFQALNRRLYRWHQQSPDEKAAFIRQPIPEGVRHVPSWTQGFGHGAGVVIDLMLPHEKQLQILIREQPKYLVTFPSNLRQLLVASERQRKSPRSLQSVGLMAEFVPNDLREACEAKWHVRTFATYSSSELGPMAFSCPERPREYRVMSENILLEIVDDAGKPCAPGQVGRVVATSLLDPLRPLIRYAIGDYAEAVSSVDGRARVGQIYGRSRNMFIRPDGSRVWPYFRTQAIADMREVEQWKLIQTEPGAICVQLVTSSPLSDSHKAKICEIAGEHLPEGTRVTLEFVTEIPRAASGKFEDFECRVVEEAS